MKSIWRESRKGLGELWGQPHWSTHPHLLDRGQLTPGVTREEYAARRQRMAQRLGPQEAMLVCASEPASMSTDIPYRYHPNNDLVYLTGFREPHAALLLFRDSSAVREVLFVKPRDPARELWDGPRTGVERAPEFGIEEVRPIDGLGAQLRAHLPDSVQTVLFDRTVSLPLANELAFALGSRRSHAPYASLFAAERLVKSPSEIALMRRAGRIAGQAFAKAMAATRPGDSELALEARLEYHMKLEGALRFSYPPVVAGGSRANILHYINNDMRLKDDELVLVDAGAEYQDYVSDISRTFPVSGRFSGPQRELYEMVLDVQAQLIQSSVAGSSLLALHQRSVELLLRGLRVVGFREPDSASLSVLYPHFVGHYLGMDVHDTHAARRDMELQDGMCITIEPGLYIPDSYSMPPHLDHIIPDHFRGLGIRIEDDLCISGDAPSVLTLEAPKSVDAIELLMNHHLA